MGKVNTLDALTSATSKARAEFSVIHGTQQDNAEIIKELAEVFARTIADLVHLAGGNNDYIAPWFDGVKNDIDLAFLAQAKTGPRVSDVFKTRRGLGTDIARGMGQ